MFAQLKTTLYWAPKKKFEGEFHDDRYYEGDLYWYYSDGRKKMRVEYSDGKVVKAQLWDRDGEQRW